MRESDNSRHLQATRRLLFCRSQKLPALPGLQPAAPTSLAPLLCSQPLVAQALFQVKPELRDCSKDRKRDMCADI